MYLKKTALVCILLSALAVAACGNGDKPAPTTAMPEGSLPVNTPVSSLPLEQKISIDGKVELSVSGDAYVVKCTSNILDGAFVRVYLSDESEGLLEDAEDIKQKDGKCTAQFPKANIDAMLKENNQTLIYATVEFFPSDKSQPASVMDYYGPKGNLLTGDNIHKDTQEAVFYAELKSALLEIK